MNGLYDLLELVHGVGASREGLMDVYAELLGKTLGKDEF